MRTGVAASILTTFWVLSSSHAATLGPTPAEMKQARQWSATKFQGAGEASEPLFSFTYGGKPSSEVLGTWETKRASRQLDATRTERTLTYRDPKTGLEVRCVAVEYADFPAVEWVLHLTNTGGEDTPIIEQIRPLDSWIDSRGKGGFAIHHSLGDSNSGRSFAPVDDVLTSERPGPLVFAPHGGRSSDAHMPYFNVDWRTGGMAAAVGWSGQWEAGFEANADGSLRFRAGQQLTHLKLYPGETIRTPRILLVFWEGADAIRGNNLFRRVMMAHYVPRREAALVLPPICASVTWADEEGNYEKPHVMAMKPFAERGIEVFWSDMDPQQWYPKGFPEGTGTWEPDTVKYPNGLKPVGDAAKAAGLGYLLWFEPERVHPGSKIDKEHPEYVMKAQGEWSQLFRLHDEKARKWLTDYIDVQITTAQITWLRWDFNLDPLGFWRRNDDPDRQGITEIRHIEGLYAMWDELRARHPGLAIDNCASGGRRIDMETCSRSLPLWHSDMQCTEINPTADQLQNGGLLRWVPLHGCGNFGLEPSYRFRSAMTAGNILVKGSLTGRLNGKDDDTAAAVRRTVAVYKQLRPYMVGDFYPLFPHDESDSQWYGYQFDNPDLEAGCVMLFRREKSPDAIKVIHLSGVDPRGSYEITDLDVRTATELSGKDLREKGWTVEIKDQTSAVVFVYKKQP
ncbi:MAG: alpha-galactosidase [Phycisphaerae bacterium]|nr:alpha-galactosidase [Phycisphaerae bacterium]